MIVHEIDPLGLAVLLRSIAEKVALTDDNQRVLQQSAEAIDRLYGSERLLERALFDLLPGTYYMDEPDGGAPTLLEQLRRMAQDAARWRAVAAAGAGDKAMQSAFENVAHSMPTGTVAEMNAMADAAIQLALENNHADL